MPKNETTINCGSCGEPTKASVEAVRVTCGKCVATGKIKTYFKDEKLNQQFNNNKGGETETKEQKKISQALSDNVPIKRPAIFMPKGTLKEVKVTRQRFGQIKYLRKGIKSGLKDFQILQQIRKDIPEYKGSDGLIMYYLKSLRSKIERRKI